MLRLRWLAASLVCHTLALAGWIGFHEFRPVAPPKLQRKIRPPARLRWVQPVAVPIPAPRPAPPARLSLARPAPRPSVHPTPPPRPRPIPSASPEARPAPRAATPTPQATPDDPIAARLAQLGLTAASASAITADVDAAIAASRGKLTPTTPTGSVAAWPEAWATSSHPVEEFLSGLLPAQKGYEAELGFDAATGTPEARIRYAAESNFVTGRALLVVARWSTAGGIAEVTVQDWVPGLGLAPGGPHHRFRMPLPPARTDREAFLDDLAGLCILGYQQAVAGQDPMSAPLP
ncbi:MAG: hypothetical protein VKO21_01270 [Candidatus Sericytochromatia bacterium]|nr:hypothetical protein [Candidatus Sericytochromatia bacterium]